MKFIAAQGDVLIFATSKIPADAKQVPRDERGRIVLAEGEVTGHAHCILEEDVTFLASDLDEMADRFLVAERECSVVHEEHATVTLPPLPLGHCYVVRPQREYRPEAPVRAAD